MTRKKILVVGDYGVGTPDIAGQTDLAGAEVKQKLKELLPDAHIDVALVPSFDTDITGRLVALAAKTGEYDIVYHNTAPRRDAKVARLHNNGEGLALAEVTVKGKAVQIIGVNAGDERTGNSFAWVKQEFPATKIHHIETRITEEKAKTQFRSRDIFPVEVAAFAQEDRTTLGEDITRYIPVPYEGNPQAAAQSKAILHSVEKLGLSRHGYGAPSYSTVIAPSKHVEGRLAEAAYSYREKEVDALAIKDGSNSWVEAGFALTQLALTASTRHTRRRFFVTTGEESLTNAPVNYHGVFANHTEVVTNDPRVLAQASAYLTSVTAYELGDKEPKAWSRAEIAALSKYLPKAPTAGYIDGYGNIKLLQSHPALVESLAAQAGIDKLHPGERIEADVSFTGADGNTHALAVQAASASFAVKDGEAALSRGSSGAYDQPYAEVFLRGGSAKAALGHPSPGDALQFERIRIARAEEITQPGSQIAAPNGHDVTPMHQHKGAVR